LLSGIGLSTLIIFLLLVVGFPVAFSFGMGSLVSCKTLGLDTAMLTSVAYTAIDSFPLMAIPFFMLAGELMTVGGLSKRLVDFAALLVAKIRGGLTHVVVLSCVFFGALSGSSVATVAAIGSIMINEMHLKGYNRKYSTALISASGFIGILIPPSIPGILYAVATGVSVGGIFLATAIPGILIALGFMLVNFIVGPKYINLELSSSDNKEKKIKNILIDSIPALMMPLIVLGGIYGGVFTPTEAAAVACVYALIVGFLFKLLKVEHLFNVFRASGISTAVILILISMVAMMGRIFTIVQLPEVIANAVFSVTTNPYIILFLLNIVFLIVGMLVETNTALLIIAPIFMPLVQQLGIDPLQFGAILILNLGVGLITPPFAANIFVAARVSNESFTDIVSYIWPYLLASIIVLFMVTYIPAVTLYLPNLILN
jgi:C4-dicarboxylate transporter DctM subunit